MPLPFLDVEKVVMFKLLAEGNFDVSFYCRALTHFDKQLNVYAWQNLRVSDIQPRPQSQECP